MSERADQILATLERKRVQQQIRSKLFSVPIEPIRIDRFEIKERLGAGAMGVVYSAFDPKLQRDVALKLLVGISGRSNGSFSHEARALAKLSHPNVLQVYEVGEYEDTTYLVSELIRGGTLRTWIASAKPRPWREVLRVLLEVARGVSAAHHLGLVHRDIKPENVLIGAEGRARIADFGLAKSSGQFDAANEVDIERSGAVVGTLRYMAPEQFRGERATPRSDQFSFCVMAFEALFGRLPFDPAHRDSCLRAMEAGEIVGVPPHHPARSVHAAIVRGLSASPDARFPMMDALIVALEHGARRIRNIAMRIALIGLISTLVVGVTVTWVIARRAGGFASNEEREVWNRALALSNARKFEECVKLLEPYPASEALTRFRVGCAQVTSKAELLERACADWKRNIHAPAPDGCTSNELQIRALIAQGKYRDCIDLIERSPDDMWSTIHFSECAKGLGTAEGYRRLCVYTKKHNPNADKNVDCSKITHLK